METNTPQTAPDATRASSQQIAAFVGSLFDTDAHHRPTPREPQRWDNLIRTAIDRVSPPQPDPQPESLASRVANILDLIALNPQPLPPKAHVLRAIAQEVVSRTELLQELATAAEQHGIIIVGGYVDSFVSEFCGNGFRLPWFRPGPPPPHWSHGELDGADLLVLAGYFAQGAQHAFNPQLRGVLAHAAAKFVEAGLSRTQSF
jgi:hypothetical protein